MILDLVRSVHTCMHESNTVLSMRNKGIQKTPFLPIGSPQEELSQLQKYNFPLL